MFGEISTRFYVVNNSMTIKWSEGKIGRLLARQLFKSDLCILPNITWTGDEIDLLVVTRNLRLIDIEIKISRADLKADKNKSKWWREFRHKYDPLTHSWTCPDRVPQEYPTKVWKHYYAMPESIWRDDLRDHIQPISGVLVITDKGKVKCVKKSKPNRCADQISSEQVIALARLASLRMWDAYAKIEKLEAVQVLSSAQTSAQLPDVAPLL